MTTVSKWGNSMGLRIPAHLAAELDLTVGSEVDLVAEDRILKVIPRQPAQRKKYSLDELLAGVTDANRHGEERTGPAVGAERLD